MRFFFVRHSESLWNVKNLCQGQKDIALSPKGLEEAKMFAAKLAHRPIGYICTSPLQRALKTAEMIKEYHPQAGFCLIEEFSERCWGPLEGEPAEKVYEFERQERICEDFKISPLMESRQDFKSRIKKGLEKAFQLHDEPLIVSHGRLFSDLCELLDLPSIRQIKNLGFMEITKTSRGWELKELEL